MINTSGNTLIIDIRDELSFEYGHIDGAATCQRTKNFLSAVKADL